MPAQEIDRARNALCSLDPSVGRSEWVRIGMAAHAAGLPFEDFNGWSAQASNYSGQRDTADVWKSFKPGGGVSAGTLFHMARGAGSAECANDNPRPSSARSVAPIARWWEEAAPAPADHPYIVRKGGSADGLRVVRGPMKGWGKYRDADLGGWLVVPIKSAAGSLESLQFIAPDGRKLNSWGSKIDGTFTVGALAPGKTAYIGEGIGHAWSLNAVTGNAAVVAFGASNIERAALAAKSAGAQPIIVPDRGQETTAADAAMRVGCAYAPLPSDLAQGSDVNDLHQACGPDAVRAMLAAAASPIPANDNPAGATISPSPFVWIDPAALPPREWLYSPHLIRKYVSATIAPGGVGKSTLVIADALAMASGRNIMGQHVQAPLRVWLWNGEDPMDELQRRISAAMLHHGVRPEDIAGRLLIDSGRDTPIKIGHASPTGPQIAIPVIDALIAAILERKIDVLIADPFVSLHSLPENDNGAMDAAVKAFAQVAHRTGCAIDLVHHSRKLNGADADIDAARGGSAIAGAVRAARALNVMSKEAADGFGIEEQDRKSFVRIDDAKANLAPASEARWFRLVGQPLGNATDERPQDFVAVTEPWTAPDAFDDVTRHDLYNVQLAIDGKQLRENVQSPQWVGHAVAQVLGLNSDARADKAKIKKLIKTWIANAALRLERITDDKGKVRPIVAVGGWATPMTPT